MKNLNTTLIILFHSIIFSCVIFSQPINLKIGNFWIYNNDGFIVKQEIIDTIYLYDSLKFYRYDHGDYQDHTNYYVQKNHNGLFELWGETDITPLKYLWTYYKENAQLGDKWIYGYNYNEDQTEIDDTLWAEVENILEGNVFGDLRIIKRVHYHSGNPQGLVDYYKYFCDDIGELSEQGYDYIRNVLRGSYIDGVAYGDTSFTVVGVESFVNKIADYQLHQNYPNPFNPSTTISYSLSKSTYVELIVYDVLGKKVAVLVDKYQTIGNYSVLFNAHVLNLQSGVYFLKLFSKSFSETKKMVLLR